MGDPRNVAHAKKVSQEKHHKEKRGTRARTAMPQPAAKSQTEQKEQPTAAESVVSKREAPQPAQPGDSAQMEKSLAVLSNLKELEFHSRANLEKLAELSLTIEEELKQKNFADPIGAVYAAQDAFQSKIVKLIEDYEAACAKLRPAG